jgi:hypothetical protein
MTELQTEAFQRLYPDQYFAKFIEQSVRPDGRPLALPRATSIGLGVVHTADSSALVKIGSTTVLAGIKCEVMPADPETPDQGRLTLQVRACRLPPLLPLKAPLLPVLSPAIAAGASVAGTHCSTLHSPCRPCFVYPPRATCAGGDGAAVLGRGAAGASL